MIKCARLILIFVSRVVSSLQCFILSDTKYEENWLELARLSFVDYFLYIDYL